MVLRKPYAFLIKHFRLIHMIITIILTYLVFKSRSIYLFLNRVIEDSVNKYDAINYINYGIYILVIILIGLWIVVYWLLKYKDKPRNVYIFSISEYIIISVFLLILYGYISGDNENADVLISPIDNTSMNDIVLCLYYKDSKVSVSLK